MSRKLNMGEKLALIFIGFSLVVTVFITASYYLQFEEALKERVQLQLSSVKQLKKVKVLNELHDHLTGFKQLLEDSTYSVPADFLLTVTGRQLPDSLAGYELPKQINIADSVHVFDLTGQQPERGITVAFLIGRNGDLAVSIVRLPEIQQILLERTGLGETGESYLVNTQRQLITKSRFDSITWQKIEVETRGVVQAFQGNPGTDVFMDYRNIKVLGAFEKIEFYGMEWVLLSEINFDEAMEPLQQLRSNLFYTFILIVAFILIVSYYLSRWIVKPFILMENRLMAVSKGILDREQQPVSRSDEIGLMFQALEKLVDALQKTVIFAGEIGKGNFAVDYERLSAEDKLGEALLSMKQQLQEYEANEVKLLKENRMSMVNGQEEERSRLSKELHDGVGPLLTTLRIQVQSSELDKQTKSNLLRQIDNTIDEVRRISNNLMPSVLEDFGVGEAINNLVEQWNQSGAVQILYKNDTKTHSELSANKQITLYRIAQEAISNSIRHSGGSEIRISLSEFDEVVALFVADNGDGFDPDRKWKGNGIRNIRERVMLVNGTIEITSSAQGTKLEIEIPLA